MPMLKKMMDLKCNLIDYEKIVDERGYRLVFFGRFAGLAGMIDTLWAFGRRLNFKNIDTPFNEIKQTIHYKSLNEIKEHLEKIGKKKVIKKKVKKDKNLFVIPKDRLDFEHYLGGAWIFGFSSILFALIIFLMIVIPKADTDVFSALNLIYIIWLIILILSWIDIVKAKKLIGPPK